jgi:hypothetical protein
MTFAAGAASQPRSISPDCSRSSGPSWEPGSVQRQSDARSSQHSGHAPVPGGPDLPAERRGKGGRTLRSCRILVYTEYRRSGVRTRVDVTGSCLPMNFPDFGLGTMAAPRASPEISPPAWPSRRPARLPSRVLRPTPGVEGPGRRDGVPPRPTMAVRGRREVEPDGRGRDSEDAPALPFLQRFSTSKTPPPVNAVSRSAVHPEPSRLSRVDVPAP